MNIDLVINDHELLIDKNDEKFINKFSSTTGSNFPKGKSGNYLGSWYEGYIFTLLIGLMTGERRYTGFVEKSQKMPSWNTATINQYKYCISLALTKPEVIEELYLGSREEIDEHYAEFNNKTDLTKEFFSKVKAICDEFSLGGIDYLRKVEENTPDLFDDPFVFKRVFDDINNQ